jgi:hypothetical protein
MFKIKDQKITQFYAGYAHPNQSTSLKLSKGYYSLSSRSNVPYVEFAGSNGYTKTISWGEWAEIDCDQLVTIRNASAHGGDIFINSGIEPDPLPSRVTVPVRITPSGEFNLGMTPWVDTRRAVRAYFVINAQGGALITVYGVSITSHATLNLNTGPGEPGPGYKETHIIPPNVAWPLIPLGYRAMLGDDTRPHSLLDKATLTFAGVGFQTAAYFVLEYR